MGCAASVTHKEPEAAATISVKAERPEEDSPTPPSPISPTPWLPRADMPLSGVNVHADYDVGTVLGRGGYSVVKSAIHRKTRREAAIKVIKLRDGKRESSALNDVSIRRYGYGSRQSDNGVSVIDPADDPGDPNPHKRTSSRLDSVMREIETMRALEHPTLLKLEEYYIDTRGSCAYLVLARLNGGDLAELLVARGRIAVTDTQVIFSRVLAGLEYMHSVGYAHRDLKLENIMLARAGDLSTATIADFGLACRIHRSGSVSDNGRNSFEPGNLVTLCGTPCYMAPEAILSLRRYQGRCFATVAQDMWSAGVLLHALLTGFFPYPSTEGHEELFQIILEHEGIDKNGRHWDGVSEPAKQLVADLLNPDDPRRLTATQALRSPWIGAYASAANASSLSSLASSSIASGSARGGGSRTRGSTLSVADSALDEEFAPSSARGKKFEEKSRGVLPAVTSALMPRFANQRAALTIF